MSVNRAQGEAERERKLGNRNRRIQWRLPGRQLGDQPRPMFSAGNIRYEFADLARGLVPSPTFARNPNRW